MKWNLSTGVKENVLRFCFRWYRSVQATVFGWRNSVWWSFVLRPGCCFWGWSSDYRLFFSCFCFQIHHLLQLVLLSEVLPRVFTWIMKFCPVKFFFYHSCYLVSEVLSHEISSAASRAWFSCAKWSSVLDIYLHNEVLSRKFFSIMLLGWGSSVMRFCVASLFLIQCC